MVMHSVVVAMGAYFPQTVGCQNYAEIPEIIFKVKNIAALRTRTFEK